MLLLGHGIDRGTGYAQDKRLLPDLEQGTGRAFAAGGRDRGHRHSSNARRPDGASFQPAAAVNAAPSNGVGSAFELTFWQSVDGSDDPAVFDAYLGALSRGHLQRPCPRKDRRAAARAGGGRPWPSRFPRPCPPLLQRLVLAVLLDQNRHPLLSGCSDAADSGHGADQCRDPPAEQSTPLARLLAQLRGKDVAAPVDPDPIEVAQAAAPVATSVSAAAAPANPYLPLRAR